MLAEAVHRVKPQAAAKGVQVALQLVARGCTVRANPDRLGQVFQSLIRTAVESTPRGGRVTVPLVPLQRLFLADRGGRAVPGHPQVVFGQRYRPTRA